MCAHVHIMNVCTCTSKDHVHVARHKLSSLYINVPGIFPWLLRGALACIVTKQPNMLIQMLALEETVKMQHYDYQE